MLGADHATPTRTTAPAAARSVRSLSPETLASVLDQSVDCVKLIGLGGEVQYMNANGLCAMEIDDFIAVRGRMWADLWPEEAQSAIDASYRDATTSAPVRFTAFCPTAKGVARWWDVTVSPVSTPDGRPAGFLSISRDVTENQQTREALEIAAAELKHRLKNTYTTVISLLRSHARGDSATTQFADEMSNRLIALSAAQSLFVSDAAPCAIAELLPALVAPFDTPDCPIAVGSLPDILVDQGQANAIALVIGELSVNSTKHGALKSAGAIDVAATVSPALLTITWAECFATRGFAHSREGGQGLRLMERIVATRRGTFAIDWHDDGLLVTLTFALGS